MSIDLNLSTAPRLTAVKHLIVILLVFLAARGTYAADPPDWEKTIQAFEEHVRLQPPQPGSVLFLGSSTIRLWNTAKAFPELNTINRGFGGSQIADSVKFADRIVVPCKPRLVVFYAGDNDIAGGKSPERVLSDFKALVEKIQAALPETRIAFISIKPSPSRWKFIEAQRKANSLVEEFARTKPRLSYIDVVEPMLNEEGQPRPELFQKDMLHLNDEGYRVWQGLVQPLIQKPAD
jgi:lysophospholipase L1-like esterase